MSGLFITLEGSEGSGKSSGAAYLAERLRGLGQDAVLTREPGGTQLGEVLRDIVLTRNDLSCTAMAELLIVFAARAQHLAHVIEPALAAGQVVLCDRFTEASYAYQGAGRELGAHRVAVLESLVHGTRQPDLTLLLDISPDLGLSRAGKAGQLDKIEREPFAFFERVREGYLSRAAEHPDRVQVIDASQSIEAVRHELWARVSAHMAANRNS